MKFTPNPKYQDLRNEVATESAFFNRRQALRAAGITTAGMALTTGIACSEPQQGGPANPGAKAGHPAPGADLSTTATRWKVEDATTPADAVSGYCNFYEFGTNKSDPPRYADAMTVSPWSISVEGMTDAPGTYSVTDLVDYEALEERVYRHRCVEAWSMVVPWVGVPLAGIVDKLKPTAEAKYIEFETYLNKSEMRGVRYPVIDWPYIEGLRLDEARNELAFMAVGVFGKALPHQNGAPLRTVVPWKYGFKGCKSIVRISFTDKEPRTAWNKANANEYGFYSNVNPNVDHPRWSQASERIIGGRGFNPRRDTDMFNGYEAQVASLYEGMDLSKNF